MKKIITICMVFMMCGVFCACGVSDALDEALEKTEETYNQMYGDNSSDKNESVASEASKEENNSLAEKPRNDKDVLNEYVGKPLPLFMDKVSQLGYKATYFNQGVDYTEILEFYTEEDCKSFLIGNLEVDQSKKTVTVDLALTSNVELAEKETALKEKLELGSSWIAAKKYGIDKYGSSFELNYLVGKIDESLYDEKTWFLKAECKVNGQKKTCEARVTGTTDNPKVVFFDIY